MRIRSLSLRPKALTRRYETNEIMLLRCKIAHLVTLRNNELQPPAWHPVAALGEQDAGIRSIRTTAENERDSCEHRRNRGARLRRPHRTGFRQTTSVRGHESLPAV